MLWFHMDVKFVGLGSFLSSSPPTSAAGTLFTEVMMSDPAAILDQSQLLAGIKQLIWHQVVLGKQTELCFTAVVGGQVLKLEMKVVGGSFGVYTDGETELDEDLEHLEEMDHDD